jgi:hypothetical protein
MNTLVWRLHRNQAFFAAATLAALVVILLTTGSQMLADYHSALASCSVTNSCSTISQTLYSGDGLIMDLVDATAVVPLLFGLFWGAPLVAKEIEDGTHSFAWTQGVTRRRWFSTNVGWVLAAAAVWGGAISALVTWWRYPENAMAGRFSGFDLQGVVPVAYSLFAVCLGIAAGALIRRVLASLAITLGGFVVVRASIDLYLRPHYLAPVSRFYSLANGGSPPPGAWVSSEQLVGPNGHVVGSMAQAIVTSCTGASKTRFLSCLEAHHYSFLAVFQPDSRYWAFQGIETGIYLVLAVSLLGIAYRRLLKGDA